MSEERPQNDAERVKAERLRIELALVAGRLGEIEMEGGSKDEHARIMRETLMALAAPI